MKILIGAQALTGSAVASAREGIQSISSTAQKVFGAVKNYLTYRVSVEGAREIAVLGDAWQKLNARLKLVTASEEELAGAQSGVFKAAQATRTDLESVASLYVKLDQAVKSLGGTQQQSLDLAQAVTQSYQVSGASAAESANSIRQLSQALASGVLRGDEFNSIMDPPAWRRPWRPGWASPEEGASASRCRL